MAFFDNFSKKVQDVAFVAAEKAQQVAAVAGEKANAAADRAKLEYEMAAERRSSICLPRISVWMRFLASWMT